MTAADEIRQLADRMDKGWPDSDDLHAAATPQRHYANLIYAIGEHPTELRVQASMLRQIGQHYIAGMLYNIAAALEAAAVSPPPAPTCPTCPMCGGTRDDRRGLWAPCSDPWHQEAT